MVINKKKSRNNVTLKVLSNEVKLTDLKELLKRSKQSKKKVDNKGLIIGYLIVGLGILALIATIIINRLVDREYFPDATIIFIMIVSLITLLFGFYILIKESR